MCLIFKSKFLEIMVPFSSQCKSFSGSIDRLQKFRPKMRHVLTKSLLFEWSEQVGYVNVVATVTNVAKKPVKKGTRLDHVLTIQDSMTNIEACLADDKILIRKDKP